jgi:Uma2 family endonuclease
MATVEQALAPLVPGDKLSQDEFLRRWEAMPDVKRAELIGGLVYMPSPVTEQHGESHLNIGGWISVYAASTPGCKGGSESTWLMLKDAPQPDAHLWVLPEFGGQARIEGRYLAGAPELAAEVSLSSTDHDLHEKMELYRSAGVQEYLVILLRDQEIRWHRLIHGNYELIAPSGDGVLRSQEFPRLWLNPEAFLAGNMAAVYESLQLGLQSPEHAEFVRALASRKQSSG